MKKSSHATRQPTGLSISRAQRTIRRVLVSDPARRWRMSDFMQAVDPTGRLNPGTLRSMIVEALPLVIRQLGVRVFRDGKANAYVLPERKVPEDAREPHLEALPLPTHEERVAALFMQHPRPWSIAEVAAAIFPHETPEQHRRHTSLNEVVDTVRRRLGWRKRKDPFHHHRRYLYGPRPA